MSDDHIKRFSLSTRSATIGFSTPAAWGPTVKDKDNAQPVIPPPKTVFIPHPRLAPPGMMGSPSARQAALKREAFGLKNLQDREFKPFAHSKDKSRSFER